MVATAVHEVEHAAEHAFSPLFIGAMVATPFHFRGRGGRTVLSVPFSSGIKRLNKERDRLSLKQANSDQPNEY